jgi:transcriptional regulator with XRE-family HTH domain
MNDRAATVTLLSSTTIGLRVVPRPAEGWLRTVREALGISRRAIGEALNVSHAAVRDYELAEMRDAISLATLRRTADALGCDLVVALVPKDQRSFEELMSMPAAAPTPTPTHLSASEASNDSEELEAHLK